MKKHIPNLITLLNLLCGCIAVVFAANHHLVIAAYFVFAGIFFDFFDGLAARKLGVQSELGVQLDSLADMVTSGVVPGLVMFQLLGETSGFGYSRTVDWAWDLSNTILNIALIGFLITLSSAYRLARFNIDEEQVDYFKGLPTPANTLLILSLPLILSFQGNDMINGIILNKWFLVGLTLLSTFLLNAPMKLFALKFKTWSFKDNATRYTFLLLSLVMLIVLKFLAVPFIVLLYILMSLLKKGEGNA